MEKIWFKCNKEGCDNRPFYVVPSELESAEGWIACDVCGQKCAYVGTNPNDENHVVVYTTITSEFVLITPDDWNSPEDLMNRIEEQGFAKEHQICRIKVYSKGIQVLNIQPSEHL